MQRFIENLLESNGLWLVVRLLLLVIFVSSGLAKLLDFEGSLAEMRAAGLHPAWLFNLVSALVLLSGSVLILFDRLVWLGAGILSVFLILTIVIVHTFWLFSGAYAKTSLYFALEHTTVIGGLMAAAIASHLRKKQKR
ncbi:DoxX family protein [Xenorhabdus sp. DI]|uniref:DoxX family protein n=1 Tax=Xenorhabdus doucetiae TaxID=351671 RepID=UPI00198B669E|nr:MULTISPECIES: DoxX family protein [unclassified Xenorhabdus]MBD2783877.1 DoxX family protein [Xenorhabdus sp. 3]MBD2788567.1 DoxX family protein [Xenorhabdus sp. DI]